MTVRFVRRATRYLLGAEFALILFLATVWLVPAPVSAQSIVIADIIVEGAQRVEDGTVRSYLVVKEGDTFDPTRINQSLKSLFATGLFADVRMRRDGQNLVVTVVENPIINRVAFEGWGEVELAAIEAEVSLRPRVIFTRTKVQNDVKRILTVYRRFGWFAATVEPKIIQLPQNRVDVVFEINEGEATKVQSIRFVGNENYDDGDLRESIQTKEEVWYRFLFSDDTYDPDRLTLDRELLRQFYLTRGYADFRVNSAVAELTPNREDFFLTFSVTEGERYKFGKVNILTTIRDLNVDELRQLLEFEADDWYDAREIEEASNVLDLEVGSLGYAFVEVRPRLNRDRENRTIDITFEIAEGPRVFVERIDISGNVRTEDKVLRREFRLVEGDAFSAAKLRRSRQRIQNLDFFESVEVERLPGSAPDKTVIAVDVEEKSTGSVNVGFGFSTGQGALAQFGISENNLLGKGQRLALDVTVAARRNEIDLTYREPYFLDREIQAGFDVFHVTEDFQDFSSFDSQRSGGALVAGYPLTENVTQRWKYELKRSQVEDVADSASSFIKLEAGTDYISEIGHTLRLDDRDSVINPTEGFFVQLSNELAGLGGSVRQLRNQVRGGYFIPVTDDVVLSLSGETGVVTGIGDDVKLQERFFVGGSNLRGFSTSGVGPRDTSTDDALGAEWMYAGTVELQFPLGLPKELGIVGRSFFDFGSAGGLPYEGSVIADETSLRTSVGVGLTWQSPFGPIGLDVGVPVMKESHDETEVTRVNFGTRF